MLNDEKRKAESSGDVAKIDHRAEIILQMLIDGFCVVSLEGKILEVNQALCFEISPRGSRLRKI